MNLSMDYITLAILLINLIMLLSSRIRACIRLVSLQGVLVACIPLVTGYPFFQFHTVFAAVFTIFIKASVFPALLFKALKEAGIRKEVEPYGGYPLSLAAGVLIFAAAFVLSQRLPHPGIEVLSLGVPVSLATFFTGLFIILSRTKAITQVIGYLMVENGICFFGAAFLSEQSLLVELAILLDIFVAVFVMGIAIFHINREFDHIDSQKLSELKDLIQDKQEI